MPKEIFHKNMSQLFHECCKWSNFSTKLFWEQLLRWLFDHATCVWQNCPKSKFHAHNSWKWWKRTFSSGVAWTKIFLHQTLGNKLQHIKKEVNYDLMHLQQITTFEKSFDALIKWSFVATTGDSLKFCIPVWGFF